MTATRLFGAPAVATAGLALAGGLTLGSAACRAQAFYDDRPSLTGDWAVYYAPRSELPNVEDSWRDRFVYRLRDRIVVPVGPEPEGGRSFAIGIGTTF